MVASEARLLIRARPSFVVRISSMFHNPLYIDPVRGSYSNSMWIVSAWASQCSRTVTQRALPFSRRFAMLLP